jgi:hypothetical protein
MLYCQRDICTKEGDSMRYIIGAIAISVLAGCAGSPPKPPAPDGEYRPINIQNQAPRKETFDFSYEGDILGVLTALSTVAPQVKVLPHVGKPIPLQIRLNMKATSVEKALQAIANQSGQRAEIVSSATHTQSTNQVFIRFKELTETVNRSKRDAR